MALGLQNGPDKQYLDIEQARDFVQQQQLTKIDSIGGA